MLFGRMGECGVMHACICMCIHILLNNGKNKYARFGGLYWLSVYVNMQGKGCVLFYALLFFCFLGRHTLTYCNCQSEASSFFLILVGYI